MLTPRALLLLTGAFSIILLPGCVDDVKRSEDVSAVAPPGGLSVKVTTLPHPPDRDRFYVRICFHNTTPKPVCILKPVDGSLTCRHMPYYRFTVRDPDGWTLPIGAGCNITGLWADTQWPQDYLVEIAPGASVEREMTVYYLQFERGGPHTVSFEYVYNPTEELFAPPPRAWRGTVKAPDFVLKVPKW